MLSANAATVRVSRAIGEPAVIAAARRNGITSPLTPVPSIALGAEGVTPVELVAAYAPFANGGNRVTPRLVTRIEAPDGTLLWSSEMQRMSPAMDPQDAYEITQMLQGVVNYGTGKAIRDMGITGPVAGKTGTTNSGEDVWFVGYTPTLVAGIWFGYDTPRPIARTRRAVVSPRRRGPRSIRRVGASRAVGVHGAAREWCRRWSIRRRGELATRVVSESRQRSGSSRAREPQETCHLHTGPPQGQIAIDANGNIVNAPGQNPIEQAGRSIGNLRKHHSLVAARRLA